MDETLTEYPDTLSLEDELDLSGEGIPTQRADFEIIEVDTKESDNGTQVVVSFENHDIVPFPISNRFWWSYTGGDTEKNQQVTRIGRGNLKRLMIAATGSATGTISGLVGNVVSAEASEDDQGFARIGSFRPAESIELNGGAEPTSL